MSNKRRIYTVRNEDTGAVHLVRAISQQQAVSHIARNLFTPTVATQEEIVSHLTSGGKVEDAAEEPAPRAARAAPDAADEQEREPFEEDAPADPDWRSHLKAGVAGDE